MLKDILKMTCISAGEYKLIDWFPGFTCFKNDFSHTALGD